MSKRLRKRLRGDFEHLFILKVLVRKVTGERTVRLNEMFEHPTVVYFGFYKFLDEKDLSVTYTPPKTDKTDKTDKTEFVEEFNSGLLVTFPVNHKEVVDCTVDMILKFQVIKRLPDDKNPNTITVGTGTLSLSKDYYVMRKKVLQFSRYRYVPIMSEERNVVVSLTYDDVVSGALNVSTQIIFEGSSIVTNVQNPKSKDYEVSCFNSEPPGQTSGQLTSYRGTNPSAIDLGETSSKTPHRLFHYPASVSESDLCASCGRQKVVEEDEKMRSEVDDGMPDVRSNDALSRDSRSSRGPFCRPVVLKVSGLFDDGDKGCKKPTVTVAEPDTARPDVASSQHDIFVLRIGKKGLVGANEKSDIQLEMKTPKGSERRPPIRCETRDIQTDPEETEPPKRDHRREKKKHKKK